MCIIEEYWNSGLFDKCVKQSGVVCSFVLNSMLKGTFLFSHYEENHKERTVHKMVQISYLLLFLSSMSINRFGLVLCLTTFPSQALEYKVLLYKPSAVEQEEFQETAWSSLIVSNTNGKKVTRQSLLDRETVNKYLKE